jgi:hypothetical protein
MRQGGSESTIVGMAFIMSDANNKKVSSAVYEPEK